MNNTITLQPKRSHNRRTLSLKRSVTTSLATTTAMTTTTTTMTATTTIAGESLADFSMRPCYFDRRPARRSLFNKSHTRNQSIPKPKSLLDVLNDSSGDNNGSANSDSDSISDGEEEEGEEEGDEFDLNNLQSPTQNRRNYLKRHCSLMSFTPSANSNMTTASVVGSIRTSACSIIKRSNCVLDQTGFKCDLSAAIPTVDVNEFQSILQLYKCQKPIEGSFCNDLFKELIIVDCRFSFEFLGGHIEGAVNVTTINELEELFFNKDVIRSKPQDFTNSGRKLIIFHCEFSSMRGPLRASQLRDLDRQHSGNDNYPNLYYPDILVLQGGYKDYHSSLNCKELGYIEMDHPQYEKEREKGLTLLRQESRTNIKRR